jgi:hypothetical protein
MCRVTDLSLPDKPHAHASAADDTADRDRPANDAVFTSFRGNTQFGRYVHDGAPEVPCFRHKPIAGSNADWQSLEDVVVQLGNGKTGEVIHGAAPRAVTARRRQDPVDANWAHQRLLIANFRQLDGCRDENGLG